MYYALINRWDNDSTDRFEFLRETQVDNIMYGEALEIEGSKGNEEIHFS